MIYASCYIQKNNEPDLSDWVSVHLMSMQDKNGCI